MGAKNAVSIPDGYPILFGVPHKVFWENLCRCVTHQTLHFN